MEKHKPVSFQAITCKKLQITYPTYSCIYYGEMLRTKASLVALLKNHLQVLLPQRCGLLVTKLHRL